MNPSNSLLRVFIGHLIFIGLFLGCKKEQSNSNSTRFNFGEISEAQKELQTEFELIINDLDNYGANGNSIDSMKITQLICEGNNPCDSTAFPKLDGGSINLKIDDVVLLSNGGITLFSLNNGNNNTEKIFLKNIDTAPEEFPFLELIEENNGSGTIYYGKIISLNTENQQIDIELWNGLLNGKLQIYMEE